MTVLRIIAGILIVIFGMDCIMTPAITTLAVGWMASIAMFVVGVVAIIRYIENKNREKIAKENGLPYLSSSVGALIFGIVSVILSIIARGSAEGALAFYKIIFVLFGLFITLQGISQVVAGVALKKIGTSGWVAMIILGVLVAALGIFCIVNSFASLVAIGTMVGVGFLFFGMSLIIGG